jgi:hypothetical protein
MGIAGNSPVRICGNLPLSAFGTQCLAQKMSSISQKIKQGG